MRYVIAIAVLLAVIGGLAAVKYQQIAMLMNAGKAMEKSGPPPEMVGTAVAKRETWEGTISAIGTVTAARGVSVSNESPGVVTAIRFESGDTVRAGQILVELDTNVERAQLASIEARKDLATLSAGRSRSLVERSAMAKSQLDGDEAQLKSTAADLSALKAQIDRKTVRAPFAGKLGIRTVNLGQYLNVGTAVTVLQALGSVYVDFTLPQQDLGEISVGGPVRVAIGGAGADGATFNGIVAAVDPAIDSATRTLKLRASVPNSHELLRPGMYVTVAVVLPKSASVVTAPATAVVHASYGDSVFVVEDAKPGEPKAGDDKSAEKKTEDKSGASKKTAGATPAEPDGKPAKVARQQFVRVGAARGDFVVIADGVKAGEELVSVGAFKLRNGASIVVNNDVKLTPELSPRPDNH